MPSKSHKAASRQAKLREKRRRGKAAAQTFEAGPTTPRVAAEESDTEQESRSTPVAQAPAAPRRARSTRPGTSGEAAPRYDYLGKELQRIGLLSIVILAILASVSVVLGG